MAALSRQEACSAVPHIPAGFRCGACRFPVPCWHSASGKNFLQAPLFWSQNFRGYYIVICDGMLYIENRQGFGSAAETHAAYCNREQNLFHISITSFSLLKSQGPLQPYSGAVSLVRNHGRHNIHRQIGRYVKMRQRRVNVCIHHGEQIHAHH